MNLKDKANEVLNRNVSCEDGIVDLYSDSKLDVMSAMIEFAKLACEEQKKICSENAETASYKLSKYNPKPRWKKVADGEEVDLESYDFQTKVNKASIKNSPTVKFD